MQTSSSLNEPYIPQPSSFLVPQRITTSELLDMGIGSAQDVRANFADMWRINRYLGGLNAITQHLYPRLRFHKEPLTLIDIGTGSADIAMNIGQWAREAQIDLHTWGLDWSVRNLAVARLQTSSDKRIGLLQADGLHLPFRTETVDYFISSLFLHHLAPEQLITLLAQTFEAAKRGVILSDIVRGWMPIIAFKLGQPVFARNYLTRQDGVTSVRRAYTPSELRRLAQAAGLSNARVYEHFPWRMTLVADK